MTRSELEEMQKRCAQEGARLALCAIGLDDKKAIEDIKDLRDLLAAYHQTTAIVWQSIVKTATVFFLGALGAGVYFKLNT